MSKDTGDLIFGHIRTTMRQRKKAASARGQRELFATPGVGKDGLEPLAPDYFGVVPWGFGAVVAGFAVGAAGLVAAGFGAGAATPDCAL